MNKIFVYGSLRKGMYNYERYLKGYSEFLGYGYVKGELYTLKGVNYPALLQGEQNILGEIYEIDEERQIVIDELEGYQPDCKQNDYNKIVCEVSLKEDNIQLSLPVYFFNMKKSEHQGMLGERIYCNDFVKYQTTL